MSECERCRELEAEYKKCIDLLRWIQAESGKVECYCDASVGHYCIPCCIPARLSAGLLKPQGPDCESCGGDGIETCDNPDHGGLEAGLFGRDEQRIGCPCCGHDPNHKMKGKCHDCNGTGKTQGPGAEA